MHQFKILIIWKDNSFICPTFNSWKMNFALHIWSCIIKHKLLHLYEVLQWYGFIFLGTFKAPAQGVHQAWSFPSGKPRSPWIEPRAASWRASTRWTTRGCIKRISCSAKHVPVWFSKLYSSQFSYLFLSNTTPGAGLIHKEFIKLNLYIKNQFNWILNYTWDVTEEPVQKEACQTEVCIDSSLAECSVPIPIPEKQRKPLTEIQEFNFLADQRAVERAEFDKKVITQILFLHTSHGSFLNFLHATLGIYSKIKRLKIF